MGVGVVGGETPLSSMRAEVRIEESEVAESRFRDARDREQKQFALALKVLSGAGDRNGEVIREWLSFPATGEIGRATKCGQVLTATLGENAQAETLEDLAGMLVGKVFVCQIGTSRDGKHSRVVHDTIGPASERDDRDGDEGEDIDDTAPGGPTKERENDSREPEGGRGSARSLERAAGRHPR
jgi:hypothetical protein